MEKIQLITQILDELFNWRALLDISLISILLFLTYHTLRRLGTWKIFIGIMIATVLFIVSYYLELSGIMWIYSNLSHVALIALIIIFQPEIRKIFERLASMRGADHTKEGGGLSSMAAAAVFAIANQKRGAILVFPGKEPIGEWTSGGYQLNADPSIPLILSIFDPNSPGHDGALIIENGKLGSFGVRLPMSSSGRLDRELGTRHHASMGLSESSDALIITVSEERGVVSVFQEGNMIEVSDEQDISTRICSHWQNSGSVFGLKNSDIRIGLVLEFAVSVAITFFIWSTMVLPHGDIREKVFTAPVEFTVTPDNVAMVGDKPSQAKLHLVGPKSDLDSVNPLQLSVKIDLAKTQAGQYTFFITESNLDLPKRVKLLDADPPSFEISLEGIITKELPIHPQVVGTTPPNITLVEIKLKPAKARALMNAGGSETEDLKIMTTPIYLPGIRETTTIYCQVIAPPSVRPVDKKWPDVEVTIIVSQDQ